MPIRKVDKTHITIRASRFGSSLQLCTRDDTAVVKTLYETKEADDVQALDHVSFFDTFFTFLRQLKIDELLVSLDHLQRSSPIIGWTAMIGVYVMRILAGLPSMAQTEGVILTDPRLMELFGLAPFVEKGITARGASRAHAISKIRGAFSGEVIADTLAKISLFALARVFNQVISILVKAGFYPKHVHAVIDCTDFEATPKYRMFDSLQEVEAKPDDEPGKPRSLERMASAVAKVTRKKRPDHRNNRHAPKVETTVWGWKVWLMFCPASGFPIAMHVDRINIDDRVWMRALVLQGKENLGGRLASVSFDRGFWDGVELYHIAQETPFFIPGKSNLEVTQEARRLAAQAYARFQKNLPLEEGVIATRPIPLIQGRGTKRKEQTKNLIIIGLSGIECPTYAEKELGSRRYSKKFEANTLNAAVVIEDPTYKPETKEDKYLVILTAAPMKTAADALFAYDRFKGRGVIENAGNKQAKSAWGLEFPLEKSEAAVYLHAYFVFMLMALMNAFRIQEEKDQEVLETGEDTAMERYRRQVERENRDKLIIRIGTLYGIIYAWELPVLLGARLRNYATENAHTVLARYGVIPGPSP